VSKDGTVLAGGSFAISDSKDGGVRLGLIDPLLNELETDQTICYVVLTEKGAVALLADLTEWLARKHGVTPVERIADKP